MADDTRILKDINRHLAKIEEQGQAKMKEGGGLTEHLSPSESAALNKNMQDIVGNFTSIVNSELQNVIKGTNRALSAAFGDLKSGEQAAQTDLMEEMADELKLNNRFMEKSQQNEFLKEAEREQDVNINRRTNELLEDILDKENEQAAESKKESKETRSFFSGGMGGLFGGLFAGRSIKGLFGAIKGAGKKVFFPLLLAGAGVEFLRGWAEAGEDASVIDKFNSGIGRMASDLSFGLISKEFFTNALEGIENAIKNVWNSFSKNWEEFINGKITAPDFFANILSDLTMGALSPEQLKKIGTQIEDGLADLVSTVVNSIIDGFITPTFDAISEKLTEILDDPIAFAKKKFDEYRAKQQSDIEEIKARAKEIQKEEGLSEKAAIQQAAMEQQIKNGGLMTRVTGKATLGLLKKFGLFSETQEEADAKAAEKAAEEELKAKKAEERRLRIEARKQRRLDEVEAARKERLDLGTKGLEEKIAIERAKTEKQNQESGTGNAMQINNNNTVSTPVDTRVENDDAMNLRRSSGVEGTW